MIDHSQALVEFKSGYRQHSCPGNICQVKKEKSLFRFVHPRSEVGFQDRKNFSRFIHYYYIGFVTPTEFYISFVFQRSPPTDFTMVAAKKQVSSFTLHVINYYLCGLETVSQSTY